MIIMRFFFQKSEKKMRGELFKLQTLSISGWLFRVLYESEVRLAISHLKKLLEDVDSSGSDAWKVLF